MHDKIAWLIKHVPLIQWFYQKIMSFFFRTLGLFIPVDNNLVLLSSYGGDQYSDSPKVLFEAMKADPRFVGYRYVWAFADPTKFEISSAEKVKIDTLPYFKTALKAKIWITNVNIERGLHFKKKSQIYLNTWHGTGPKKSGNAVKGRKDYDFSDVDIVCVDGKYLRDIFVKYFNAKDENMLYCGRPREDELICFTEADRVRIRSIFSIPKDKKMILYMPTWREYGNRELNQCYWEEKLGNDYVVFVRAHHFSKSSIDTSLSMDFWRDATGFSDVNELYCAADILVSDYSSAFWDYALLGKPMFCYAYDYDEYCKSTGLLLDLRDEFPNGIMETEKQLLEAITTMDEASECEKTREFAEKFVSHPGCATEACLDRIAELLS